MDSHTRYYCEHLARFPVWARDSGHTTVQDACVTTRLNFSVFTFPVACLNGHLKLKVGDWVMAHPNFLLAAERESMWFGRIELIFEHIGPNGIKVLMLKV